MCDFQFQAKKFFVGESLFCLNMEIAQDIQRCNISINITAWNQRKGRKNKWEQTAREKNRSLMVCALYIQISILTSCSINNQRDPANL